MSDPSGYEDVYVPEGTQPPDPQQPNEQRSDYLVRVPRGNIRTLEEQAKQGRDAATRASQLERENAFLRAGVDISTNAGQVFARGYDGELKPEAVQAAAREFGLLEQPADGGDGGQGEGQSGGQGGEQPPPVTPDAQLEPGEDQLSQRRAQLTGQAPPDQPDPGDPYRRAQEIRDAELANGAQEKVAIGHAINSIANAAHNGDKRVIIPSRSVQAIGGGSEESA